MSLMADLATEQVAKRQNSNDGWLARPVGPCYFAKFQMVLM